MAVIAASTRFVTHDLTAFTRDRNVPVNVLRLLTFGGLSFEAYGAAPVPRLRRPWLAMLAVIAASGDRGVPRERLIAILWPDSDEEHARHSARQALYGVRQELGRDVVRSSGATLALDPAAITSDVGDFRAALAMGDRALAVTLVRGPFLDAFYLPGTTSFERWLEEERGRLASATTSALLALATDAARANDRDAAVEWWRQLTVLDPLSGRYVVGYLKALAVRGDRAEALAFARRHEFVIRRELEAEPDPDVRRIEAELRAMTSPPIPAEPTPRAVAPLWSAPPLMSKSSDLPPTPGASAAPPHRTPRRVPALLGAAALLLIVSAAFARQLGWLRRPASSESPTPTFAVGLIREEDGEDSLRHGRVLTDLVATDLARVERLRVLANSRLLELLRPGADSAAGYSEAARRAGATDLLEGQLFRANDAMTLELRRVELHTGIVKDVYRVTARDRYALVDSMTRAISRRMQLSSPRGSIADATTTSLVAYRLYEEGLRALHQGDVTSAQRLMRAAVTEDSMFAMAAWYEAWLGVPEPAPPGWHVTEARQRALRLAQRAPERERLLISASVLADNNDPSAMQVAESLTTRYPHDPRALAILARTQDAAGDWARAVAAMERAIALDSIAEVDETSICRVCDDFYRLSEFYSWWDSLPAVQRTARRYQLMRPKLSAPYVHLAMAGARLGDSASAYSSYRRLAAVGPVSPFFKFALDLSLEDYDLVERDVRRLLGSSSMSDWGNGAFTYFIALRAQGRLREAVAFNRHGWIPGLLPLLVEREPSVTFEAIAALETGDARGAVRWFERLPSSPDSKPWAPGIIARTRSWRGTLTGMALAAAGDTFRLRALADSVERWGRASAYGRDQRSHHYLRGMLDVAAGRDAEAVRRFRTAIHSPSLGFTRVNYELARALLRLDRPREAVTVLQASLRGVADASNLYISRTELHELLAESFARAGVRDSAAFHYGAVVKAWRRADPRFHSRRDRAAAWLARNPRATNGSQ